MDDYGIYNVDFGKGAGHEQSYQRPAIIFKRLPGVDMYLVIPLTGNLEHLNLPYTAQINKTTSTNLRDNSAALVFQIRAIDASRVTGHKIGFIEEYQVNKIKALLKDMLSLG
jgi:mRNA-degrading endonuclease toxin of MazEF toxin-antitoxin module